MELADKEKETLLDYIGQEGQKKKDIADQLGMSSEHFSRLINGRAPFTNDRAVQLYETLGKPEELAFLIDEERFVIPKDQAWKNLYDVYSKDLFRYFMEAPIGDRPNILRDLEDLVDKYKK
ncbi:MAG: hypothetical protein ABIG93_04140 [archaeon]|nr:hypothetical protein [Nanoarchaeota archaeon]